MSETSNPALSSAGDSKGVSPRVASTAARVGESLAPAEHAFLLELQLDLLRYFLDNQTSTGLVLDRQRNHGPREAHGLCSTATTGMGLIGLALAAQSPYRLLSHADAVARIRAAMGAALDHLPHEHGIMPHFVHSADREVHGADRLSTIDSSWLVAGALAAAALLEDLDLETLAAKLYDRIDWHHWTAPDERDRRGLIRHGKGPDGHFLGSSWDRLNGETVFMYVLAAGAAESRSIARESWRALSPFYGTVAGLRFNNSDLGLFVFQYGLDLLDPATWRAGDGIDLWAEARVATTANYHACRLAAERFTTYRFHWGISAGDGPGQPPSTDIYRCYTPAEALDGTAHLTAALAAVAHAPAIVLDNLRTAENDGLLRSRGRYGFSNINVDEKWVGRDMIGIDAGAAMLALDNYLMNDRIRTAFHSIPCVQQGLRRLGFHTIDGSQAPPDRLAA
jgi:hypothetical protein